MPTTANGERVTECEITMPRVGAWHADFEVDTEVEFPKNILIESYGQIFGGSFVRGKPYAGRTKVRIVGGGGGLSRTVEAKNYAQGPAVRTIVADILGPDEQLSDTADAGILDSELPSYHLVEGVASHLLTRLLDKFSATWRVLADGSVWVGQETYPTFETEHTLIDEDWFAGNILIAPEAPDLRPGVTFNGHELEHVVHTIKPDKLRTELQVASTGSALSTFLAQIRRQIDYTKRYPSRVVKVNGDGTIQVEPDDTRIKGTGLDKVRVRSGVPGTITPKKNARCLLGWDGGDPSAPYASDWDGEDVTELQLADGVADAARAGSTVTVYFPPAMPVSGTLNGQAFVGVLAITTPGYGMVDNGNPLVKV